MSRRFPAPLLPALALLVLAGCGADDTELSAWMQQQKNEVRPSVQPLQAPKRFDPQAYLAAAAADPFSAQKLSVAIKQEAQQPSSLMASEMNRRKEPLEAFPLDRLDMVGTIGSGSGIIGLVMGPDKVTYRVRPGNYMGLSDGRVTAVFDDRVEMVELVPDGAGGWLERQAKIALEDN